MKKLIISTAIFGAAMLVAFFLYDKLYSMSNCTISLIDANIEALANGENSTSCTASANCYEERYNFNTGENELILKGSVSCKGTEVCKSGDGYVECDGNTSSCE